MGVCWGEDAQINNHNSASRGMRTHVAAGTLGEMERATLGSPAPEMPLTL